MANGDSRRRSRNDPWYALVPTQNETHGFPGWFSHPGTHRHPCDVAGRPERSTAWPVR